MIRPFVTALVLSFSTLLGACAEPAAEDVADSSASVISAPSYQVVAVAKVKPGTEADFRQAAIHLVDNTRKEPGNLSYQLLETQDPTTFIFEETWKDAAASEAHMTGPVLGTFFAHVKDEFEPGFPLIETVREINPAR